MPGGNSASRAQTPAHHDLHSIPGGVAAVVIGTRPDTADERMRECAELGIKHA